MSLSPFLRKVLLIDLVKGLKVTFNYQKPSEAVTEQYPLERPVIYERYRGQPRLRVAEESGSVKNSRAPARMQRTSKSGAPLLE